MKIAVATPIALRMRHLGGGGTRPRSRPGATGLGGRCTRRQGRRGRSGDPGRLLPASAARTCSRRRTSPPSSDRRSAYTCSPGLLWRPEPWRRPTRPCASVRAAPGTRPSGRPEPLDVTQAWFRLRKSSHAATPVVWALNPVLSITKADIAITADPAQDHTAAPLSRIANAPQRRYVRAFVPDFAQAVTHF